MVETLCFPASLLTSHSPPSHHRPSRSVSFHDQFSRRCFTVTQPPPGLVVSDHTGPLNPPSPLSSHSWPERGEKAGPPYYLWVWIRLFIAYTHHCRTLHTAPRTWATRNSRSLGPGKSQGIRRGDMVFLTQPPCWTYVPRLKSGEGEGDITGSK